MIPPPAPDAPTAACSAVVIVLTTLPVEADAAAFARTLVEERLAACVSVGGEMHSTYRWKDAVDRAAERQVVMKTVRDKVALIEARLATLHPYEVPELLVIPAEDGGDAYIAWVRQCTST